MEFKAGLLRSVLLVFLVVSTSCSSVEELPPPPTSKAPTEPLFMRGFVYIDELTEPHVGSLVTANGIDYGSAVLVDPLHALTAGHCVSDITPKWFVVGGEVLEVAQTHLHPNYKVGAEICVDLAVVTLAKPSSATPARLPSGIQSFARGERLTVIGFAGGTKRMSGPCTFWYYGTTIESPWDMKFLPLEGTIWFGDSGGALQDADGVLVGIVSSMGSMGGTIFENSATRTDIQLEWIYSITGGQQCDQPQMQWQKFNGLLFPSSGY